MTTYTELLASLQVMDSSYKEALKRLEAKYGTPAQIMARVEGPLL